MERNIQRTGLINLVLLLALGLAAFGMAAYAHSLTGQVAAVFVAIGVLSTLVSLFQMRLEERERLEKLELDELSQSSSGGALFESSAGETFPAQRSREQFEKYFVPGFTVFLMLAAAGAAWRLSVWLRASGHPGVREPLVALGVFGLAGLASFLLGKYSAGLVRLEKQRLLGPSASHLLLSAYLYFLTFIVLGLDWAARLPQLDRIVALILCGLLALLALEAVLTLVLEIYRPRLKGRATRILYESRLVGLLSHPEGLVSTAAHALDYQFGFKVSDTWVYRFMERAVSWLILAQFTLLILSSCLVFVQTGEQALLERFGRPLANREILEPGLHFKFPWPIDKTYRFRTHEVQTVQVGAAHEEHAGEEKAILWTIKHSQQEVLLMVAAREEPTAATAENRGKRPPPVNLLSASIPVRFQIKDLKAFAYQFANARQLLELLATREVVRYMVSADYQEVTSSARASAAEELRRRIQQRVDERGLGIEVLFVGLADIHPPVAVAQDYEKVVSARHKREANILDARDHAIRTNALAMAKATRTLRQAEAYRQQVEQQALAEAAFFTNQWAAYQASPRVYAQRAYLDTLTRFSQEARKIIITATNLQNVIQLNLEDKLGQDWLDLSVPTPKQKP